MVTDHCALLLELSHNVQYQILIFVKFSLCLAGVCGICYQWHKQGVRFLVHENTKVLFNFYYALNLFTSSIFMLIYLFELIRLRYDCVLINFRTVILSKGLGMSAVFSAHFIIIYLSFERLYSTLFPARFEKHSNRPLTAILASTVTVVTFAYTVSCLSNGFRLFRDHIVAFIEDERIAENDLKYKELMIVMAMSNALSLVMFSLDVYLNFIRKPSTNTSLAVSYQRAENRRVILTLLPIELTDSLLTLITIILQILRNTIMGNPSEIGRQMFTELSTYPMFFPLILAIFIELRVGRRTRDVTNNNNAKEHFEALKRAWS